MDLNALLHGNQFLSGGLLLGAVAAAGVFAKQYAQKGLRWLWERWTVELTVRNTEAPFDWLVLWLSKQPYTQRARRVTASVAPESNNGDGPAVIGGNVGGEIKRPIVVLSPSEGSHFFLYQNRLVWLKRDRAVASKDQWRDQETFTVTMSGGSQDLLRALLSDAFDAFAQTVRQRSRIFVSIYNGWEPQGFVRPRPLDSVILPGTEKEDMMDDLRTFLGAEDWYHDMGIPYRRGYLLYGVPGSGKSSLVAAVAGSVGLHLYMLSLAGLTDNGLQETLQRVRSPRAIILIEDIDAARAAQNRKGKRDDATPDNRVSLSGLLNALDGVASRDGYITIMTTNRRETLDPAITRPGRVDVEIEFGWATVEQASALYTRFYGVVPRGFDLPPQTSMAALQEHFLRHRNDPIRGARLGELPALRVVNDE